MCGSSARTDLYGGQLAMAVPTVTGTVTYENESLLRTGKQGTGETSIDDRVACGRVNYDVFMNQTLKLDKQIKSCRLVGDIYRDAL